MLGHVNINLNQLTNIIAKIFSCVCKKVIYINERISKSNLGAISLWFRHFNARRSSETSRRCYIIYTSRNEACVYISKIIHESTDGVATAFYAKYGLRVQQV